MRILTAINSKGGTGKTTLTANLGAALAELGRRVLLVDLDPQECLTLALGITADRGAWELLTGQALAADLIRRAWGLDLIPGSPRLAEWTGPAGTLRDRLAGLQGYDYAILDPPPSTGPLVLSALAYAREVLIPVPAEYLPYRGIARVLEIIEAARGINPSIRLAGIVITLYNGRRATSAEVEAILRDQYGGLVLKTKIRDCVSLANAPILGKPVIHHRGTEEGAEDYRALAREIEKRGEG